MVLHKICFFEHERNHIFALYLMAINKERPKTEEKKRVQKNLQVIFSLIWSI